jgi:hypothetical protein
MESVLLLIALALVAGATWYFLRDDGKITKDEIMDAVEDATDLVEDVVEEVKATVEKVVTKEKLPTKAKLTAMTKAQIEDLGREFGIELDKRKTKDNMISDLRAAHKKL